MDQGIFVVPPRHRASFFHSFTNDLLISLATRISNEQNVTGLNETCIENLASNEMNEL